MGKRLYAWIVMLGACCALALPGAAAAQVAAALPDKDSVERGEPTDADGTYVVSTINKRITIEDGRAYVVDPWTQALIFSVKPGMVTLRNFRQTGPDRFEADDLPMMGKVVFYRQPNGTLQGVVNGVLGEAKYALVPTDLAAVPGDEIEDSGGGPGDEIRDPGPPPDRVYTVFLSGADCTGKSWLRKRYVGQMRVSLNRLGETLTSKSRNFAVQCKDGGKHTQNFLYYKDGPGSLTLRIPYDQQGFSNLKLRGELTDVLGVVPIGTDKSNLIQNASDLGRDLNVGETVKDRVVMIDGSVDLHFTVTMKRTQ